ncbi:WhiB family transcriptional regulator [Streptomyces halobius]|uniref:Transcriptional regulator WhiB n=1 Tax=Streptomyces halobius TaxID=2879846 RepID=A0ABY4MDD0_9ACTN|nr:WhiB family transcriptional regulator [Streptomyces halobius]UQA95723.1 WhiB family transcriptional regulator [Streptomyces halobius]
MPRPSRYAPDNLPRPEHWARHAACRGAEEPDVFFPDGDVGLVLLLTEEAKAYCRRCPVRSNCLTTALNRREPLGIWGGLDTDERRALVRLARERAEAAEREEEQADARASAA